jgi:hypothetical protein
MENETEPRVLSDAELDHVHGGAPPDQGSGKNPSGNKVDVFAGNPHDRPGANAKVTP